MTNSKKEITLINVGNNTRLHTQANIIQDIFLKEPILLDQITMGSPFNPREVIRDFKFLLFKVADKRAGVVYYKEVSPGLVEVHIAIKREFQINMSKDIARKAIDWFTRNPTIHVIGASIPEKAPHAVRFAKSLGFQRMGSLENTNVGTVGMYFMPVVG